MRKRSATFIESTAMNVIGEEAMDYLSTINTEEMDNLHGDVVDDMIVVVDENDEDKLSDGLYFLTQPDHQGLSSDNDDNAYIASSYIDHANGSISSSQKQFSSPSFVHHQQQFTFVGVQQTSVLHLQQQQQQASKHAASRPSPLKLNTSSSKSSTVVPSPSVSPATKMQISNDKKQTTSTSLPPVPLFNQIDAHMNASMIEASASAFVGTRRGSKGASAKA